jgi:hypothetical protein
MAQDSRRSPGGCAVLCCFLVVACVAGVIVARKVNLSSESRYVKHLAASRTVHTPRSASAASGSPSASPTAADPAPPPQAGYVSVLVSGQQEFIDVPDPADSQNLTMSRCVNTEQITFDCLVVDTAPSDASGNFYDNQQWRITDIQLSNGWYIATLASNFSGSWADPASGQLGPDTIAYLSYLNIGSGSGNVGLVPIDGSLDAAALTSDPASDTYQYWILRPEGNEQWELSPWEDSSQCLGYSPSSIPYVGSCAPGAADQLWAIGLSRN